MIIKNNKGSIAVEFALIFPLILLSGLFIFQLSFYFIDIGSVQSDLDNAIKYLYLYHDLNGLSDVSHASIQCSCDITPTSWDSCSISCSSEYVKITVSKPFSGLSLFSLFPSSLSLSSVVRLWRILETEKGHQQLSLPCYFQSWCSSFWLCWKLDTALSGYRIWKMRWFRASKPVIH